MKIKRFCEYYYPMQAIVNNHIVHDITDSSKEVRKNDVFVAIRGYVVDGHQFIAEAIERGAGTVVVQRDYQGTVPLHINVIRSDDTKKDFARLLAMKYHNVSKQKPIIIGVTGTSGKTTVTSLLYQYLKHINQDVLLLGTSGNYSYYCGQEVVESTTNTTPHLKKIYQMMYEKPLNYDYVIMEVSSQGIAEGRVDGLMFDIVVLTNLTPEHLDYHKTMDDYRQTKGRIMTKLTDIPAHTLILNSDSNGFAFFNRLSLCQTLTYGMNSGQIRGKKQRESMAGTEIEITKENGEIIQFTCHLLGEFNIYNLLAVWAVHESLGFSQDLLLDFLSTKIQVAGRMQISHYVGRAIVIDYAHTSNAVHSVLTFLNREKTNRLITVIGCGGNRDTIKRPVIGKIATELSDYVYFTEDNSRDEDIRGILSDIVAGVANQNYEIVFQREDAIEQALLKSEPGDTIAIIGKGSEQVMIGKVVRKYSDIETVKTLCERMEWHEVA